MTCLDWLKIHCFQVSAERLVSVAQAALAQNMAYVDMPDKNRAENQAERPAWRNCTAVRIAICPRRAPVIALMIPAFASCFSSGCMGSIRVNDRESKPCADHRGQLGVRGTDFLSCFSLSAHRSGWTRSRHHTRATRECSCRMSRCRATPGVKRRRGKPQSDSDWQLRPGSVRHESEYLPSVHRKARLHIMT